MANRSVPEDRIKRICSVVSLPTDVPVELASERLVEELAYGIARKLVEHMKVSQETGVVAGHVTYRAYFDVIVPPERHPPLEMPVKMPQPQVFWTSDRSEAK